MCIFFLLWESYPIFINKRAYEILSEKSTRINNGSINYYSYDNVRVSEDDDTRNSSEKVQKEKATPFLCCLEQTNATLRDKKPIEEP